MELIEAKLGMITAIVTTAVKRIALQIVLHHRVQNTVGIALRREELERRRLMLQTPTLPRTDVDHAVQLIEVETVEATENDQGHHHVGTLLEEMHARGHHRQGVDDTLGHQLVAPSLLCQ